MPNRSFAGRQKIPGLRIIAFAPMMLRARKCQSIVNPTIEIAEGM
jgi:hypothetical protein